MLVVAGGVQGGPAQDVGEVVHLGQVHIEVGVFVPELVGVQPLKVAGLADLPVLLGSE
jgi:hypothetical protein